MSKIDMTGWVMKEHNVKDSLLTVIEEAKNYKQEHGITSTSVYWLCKCECGNEKVISGRDIRTGHTLSCGCLHKTKTQEKFSYDITGQKFGYLTALESTHQRQHSGTIWKCLCECGNITYVPVNYLTSGHTKSCGCMRNKLAGESITKDISIGTRFGKLTVLEKDEVKEKNHQMYWKCRCDCGTILSVNGVKLRSGHTKSCGCLNSAGELKIKELLNQSNIQYESEKKFLDCVSPLGYSLPFDFYVNGVLIEFDGIQHYEPSSLFGGEEALQKRQEYDSIKNEYCRSHNIPLKRIPYWELNKLTIEDLLGDKFLINKGEHI